MTEHVLPDPATPFGERVRRRLRVEQVIWFTTVGRDGTPQPNPVWFLWDGEGIVVYCLASAKRVAHVRGRPQVALNFDGDGRGGDIVVLTGRAHLAEDQPAAHECPPYLEKYRAGMAAVSGSPEAFSQTYSVPIRVEVTAARGH
jgi:PPOX class probable F420-dependent enzyme